MTEGTRTVSAEEYMAHYAHDHYEWVRGELIEMSPVGSTHNKFTEYLGNLIEAYLVLNPVAQYRVDPFTMRVDATQSRRQPDLQVILNDNPGELTETYMHGPADIVIEVVSPESAARDHGEKFAEYEQGGVREYWIIDPTRSTCRFERLNEAGHYTPQLLVDGLYTTPLLPKLQLHVPTLWADPLPDILQVVETVKGWF